MRRRRFAHQGTVKMKITPIGRNRAMAAVVVSALFAATTAVAEAPAGAMTASDQKPPKNESLMRLNAPRIAPLQDAELTDEQLAILSPLIASDQLYNIFRTFARTPKALQTFLAWGGYIMSADNSLTPRQREIVILRVGYLCRSGYEFAQHVLIGLQSGLTEAEIGKIKQGAEAGWTPEEAALIRMADELVADHFVSDPTWAQLRAHFSEKNVMDAVYTAGQYTQVSMFLNTFGVQLDRGLTLDPDLRR